MNQVFETNNYEEAKEFLAQTIGFHKSELIKPEKSFFSHFSHVNFYRSRILYLEWQGEQKLIRHQPENLYILYLPLRGFIEEEIDGKEYISHSQNAHIFTPEQFLKGRLDDKGKGLSVCINKEILEEELSKLLNTSLNKNLVFFPDINLTDNFGKNLKDFILFCYQSVQNSSLFLPQLEQTLLTGILQHQNHNYKPLFLQDKGELCDRQIKLAIDFMRINLQKPISLGDISKAVGVSSRSLQRKFVKYCNCSPIQFLHQIRLDALHQDLKNGITNYFGISDLMLKYQFNHFGRCSNYYKKRFGELPSDTIKKAIEAKLIP